MAIQNSSTITSPNSAIATTEILARYLRALGSGRDGAACAAVNMIAPKPRPKDHQQRHRDDHVYNASGLLG